MTGAAADRRSCSIGLATTQTALSAGFKTALVGGILTLFSRDDGIGAPAV